MISCRRTDILHVNEKMIQKRFVNLKDFTLYGKEHKYISKGINTIKSRHFEIPSVVRDDIQAYQSILF